MATYCPNPSCNHKLKITEWKLNCPECGTNILYFNMEERLQDEADQVDISSAAFRKRAARAKASLIGDKWAIARLVLLFVPILTLLLPLGKAAVDIPFFQKTLTLNVISVVEYVMNLNFDALFGALKDPLVSTPFIWLALSIVCFLLIVAACVLGLVFSFLAGSPKGFLRAVIVAVLGVAATAMSAVSLHQYNAALAEVMPGALSAAVGFGVYAVAAAFLLGLGINIFIKAKGGVPVKYPECLISGFPEEEVMANLAKGITLDDMRRARSEAEAALAAEAAQAEAEAEPAEE